MYLPPEYIVALAILLLLVVICAFYCLYCLKVAHFENNDRQSAIDNLLAERRNLKRDVEAWREKAEFHQEEEEKLKAQPTAQPNQSLELTEFLRDQSQFGYSFVRVDPNSVYFKSPRGNA